MARIQSASPEVYPGVGWFVHLDTLAENRLVDCVLRDLCDQGRPFPTRNEVALNLIRDRKLKVRCRAKGRHLRDVRLWALSQYWNAETRAQERDAERQLVALGIGVA